jgi:exodeoxyribonuclease VII large subunit
MPEKKDYLTVSELNNLIQNVIQAGFPQPVWLCGEIQGYDRNRGKNHIFFEIVEKDHNSKNIIAKIGLVLFAGRKASINDILKRSENAFALKDDIEVKFACSIDFYPPHGTVRLIVESIDPTYTLGRFAQEKQKLIALLKTNGILDKNKQVKMPLVPMRVGLITADDSAAYNDFCSELKKSDFGFKLYLCNALMQGKNAEQDICRAIDTLNGLKGLDVIVITRGGGSIADLSCFDSQLIAEKIAGCPRPVLCGIGHEINISIADMAAHAFAKTPTAIAQFLVNHIEEFLGDLNEKKERIIERAREKIRDEQQKLRDHATNLQNNTRVYLKSHNEQIIRMQEVIKHRPGALLKDHQKSLKERRSALKKTIDACLENNHLKLANYKKMIDIVHPANTIKRGFSITRTGDGKILKSIHSVHAKEKVSTEVADGVITSEVQRLETVL